GEKQAALGEVERGESVAPGQVCVGRLPVQPPGDHQMNDRREVVLEPDDDALAEAPEFQDASSLELRELHPRRAQDEWVDDATTNQSAAEDTADRKSTRLNSSHEW